MKKLILVLLLALAGELFSQQTKYNPISGQFDYVAPSGIKQGDQGETEFTSGVVLGDAITVNISANTNNLVIPDVEKHIIIRLNVSGNRDLTGIVPANTEKAWMMFVANVGGGQLGLKNNSASSDANNRFLIGGNKTLQSDEGILLFYDPISKRWRGSGIII